MLPGHAASTGHGVGTRGGGYWVLGGGILGTGCWDTGNGLNTGLISSIQGYSLYTGLISLYTGL